MHACTADFMTAKEQMFDQNLRGVSTHPLDLTQFAADYAAT